MNEGEFGSRDKRGEWRPFSALSLPPWAKGETASSLASWLRSFLFGWNAVFLIIALLYYALILPPLETMQRFNISWVLLLLLVNMIGIAVFFGLFELRLYWQKRQGHEFKYNQAFPYESGKKTSSPFWFQSQNVDNFLRSIFITVPLGTGVQVLTLWAMAQGYFPVSSLAENPLWFIALFFLIPLIHEAYFYFIHRLLHWGGLYRHVHSVHHNSLNPSPWSSLSMHPIEGLLYFGTVPLQLLLFSNPFLVVWSFIVPSFGAVIGHIGFDKIVMNDKNSVNTHALAHYLHHKYFEVNYCDDGILPWDYWFDTWHDGTKFGDQKMQARFQQKTLNKNKGKI